MKERIKKLEKKFSRPEVEYRAWIGDDMPPGSLNLEDDVWESKIDAQGRVTCRKLSAKEIAELNKRHKKRRPSVSSDGRLTWE